MEIRYYVGPNVNINVMRSTNLGKNAYHGFIDLRHVNLKVTSLLNSCAPITPAIDKILTMKSSKVWVSMVSYPKNYNK